MKIKFKEYSKQYEDVFSSEEALKNCDLSLITNDKDMSFREYSDFMGSFLKSATEDLFNIAVKFYWAQRRFFYRGLQKKKLGRNWFIVDNAFATFTRHYMGVNHRVITDSFYFWKIITYLEELFPKFDSGSPFTNPDSYKFPYKNITADFLTVVYQMPERMDLLRVAEEKNMSYAVFLDYVVNYVYCSNDEHGARLEFMYVQGCPPYVRYNFSPDNRARAKRKLKKYEQS